MASRWNHEQLSVILSSTQPSLSRASINPSFPSLSRRDEDFIRDTDPSSIEGRMLCTFQDLLTHRISPRAAADILGSLTSTEFSSMNYDASLLWGAICNRGETWPEAELGILAKSFLNNAGPFSIFSATSTDCNIYVSSFLGRFYEVGICKRCEYIGFLDHWPSASPQFRSSVPIRTFHDSARCDYCRSHPEIPLWTCESGACV
jgi:hypothetical protein